MSTLLQTSPSTTLDAMDSKVQTMLSATAAELKEGQTTADTTNNTAAHKVLNITELLENILIKYAHDEASSHVPQQEKHVESPVIWQRSPIKALFVFSG